MAQVYFVLLQSTRLTDRLMDGQTERRTEDLGNIMSCISYSGAVQIALSDKHRHVCQLKSRLSKCFPLYRCEAVLHCKTAPQE